MYYLANFIAHGPQTIGIMFRYDIFELFEVEYHVEKQSGILVFGQKRSLHESVFV